MTTTQTTLKKTSDLKPGDIVDLGFTQQAVRIVTPPKGLTTYWVVTTADSDTHHGSNQGVSGDMEWTVVGHTSNPKRMRRTASALEKAMTF